MHESENEDSVDLVIMTRRYERELATTIRIRKEIDALKEVHAGEIWSYKAEIRNTKAKLRELELRINAASASEFLASIPLEYAYQFEAWSQPDAKKSTEDWHMTVAWILIKLERAMNNGDTEKAKHHAITAATVLYNWHRHITIAEAKKTNPEDDTST